MGGGLFAYKPPRRLTYISEMCGIIESEAQASVLTHSLMKNVN